MPWSGRSATGCSIASRKLSPDSRSRSNIVDRGFAALWSVITTDRALLVAWFGLRAEAITDPVLQVTARYLSDRLRALIAGLIDDALSSGRTLAVSRSSLEVLIMAGLQGLILEYLERGETDELEAGIGDFQKWLTAVSASPAVAG